MTSSASPPNRRRKRLVTIAALGLLAAGMHAPILQSHNEELKTTARLLFAAWVATALIAISLNAVDYLSTIILAQALTLVFCLVITDYADPDWDTLLGCTCVGTLVGIPVGLGYAVYRWLERPPST